MESLVRSRLMKHFTVCWLCDFISHNQHGFLQGRSCSTQLLEVLDIWTQILDNSDNVDVVYLDFAKAFDTVPHRRLLIKVQNYGVGGHRFP